MPSTHIWPCGNTSHNLIRKAQHSHPLTNVEKASTLTLGHARNQSSMSKVSALTSENQCQKGSALIFDHARNQSFMPKGLCTYIWQPMSEGRALTSDHVGTNPIVTSEWLSVSGWAFLVTNQVPPFQEWNSVLISDHVGTNPTVTSEWLNTHIWHGRNQSSHHDRMARVSSFPLGGNLDLENTKLLLEVLHFGHF